jgi:hypothetical protein
MKEELEEAFIDLGGEGHGVRITAVGPPPDLGPDTAFELTIDRGADASPVVIELPTSLAMGYLADEEAAVDEWRHWVHRLWEQLRPRDD